MRFSPGISTGNVERLAFFYLRDFHFVNGKIGYRDSEGWRYFPRKIAPGLERKGKQVFCRFQRFVGDGYIASVLYIVVGVVLQFDIIVLRVGRQAKPEAVFVLKDEFTGPVVEVPGVAALI